MPPEAEGAGLCLLLRLTVLAERLTSPGGLCGQMQAQPKLPTLQVPPDPPEHPPQLLSLPCLAMEGSEHSTHHAGCQFLLPQGLRLPGDHEPPGLYVDPATLGACPGPSMEPVSSTGDGHGVLTECLSPPNDKEDP